jgi:Ctr copper transporter family
MPIVMMSLQPFLLIVLFVHAFRYAAGLPFELQHQEDTTIAYTTSSTTTRRRAHHTATTDDASSSSIFEATIATSMMEHAVVGGLHEHQHVASTQESNQQEAHVGGSEQKSVPNVNDSDDNEDQQPFCRGMPMTMFMDGFHWSLWRRSHNNTSSSALPAAADMVHKPPRCLVYFVSSWELSEEGKFKGAMVFSFLMGLLMEGLSAMRAAVSRHGEKSHSSAKRKRNLHHVLMTLIYALQGLLGYLLMFLTMAYSVELVLSTVLGLVVGNLCLIRYEYPKASSRRVDYVPPTTTPTPTQPSASTATATTTYSHCPEREPLLASASSNPGIVV